MSSTTDARLARGFFGALVRRPVTLLVLFASMVVIGLISYQRIPVQMMPDGFTEPGLWITAANPGASAKENEEKVARILEEELRTLAGVERMESDSRDDFVSLQIEFNAELSMDLLKAEVRDRLERARAKLPSTVREIQLFSWSQSDLPVMFFAILHPGDSAETDALIDNVIQRKLEAVDGVAQLEIWGVLDDSIRILLDEDRVRAANLDLGNLIERLSSDNFALPLGEVTDGGRRVLLRSDMRFKSREEIERYPIGKGLAIRDVGRVIDAKSVRNRLFRIDGSYSYYGEIRKDSQANAVATCERLRAAFTELEADPRLAGKFRFLPLFDQGEFIQSSIAQLVEAAYYGGLFSVIVLFVFLKRVRMTIAVALAIPISVLFAIAWQFLGGGTFNVLTMTGITLALGMLVDNAIVVIENIVRWKQLGHSDHDAAAGGTREVGLAVLLSTLTTVVVFMPLIFMTSQPQLALIFGEIGLPLCTSLLFSLLVALIFLPVVAARILGPRAPAVQRSADRLRFVGEVPARAAYVLTDAIGATFAWGVRGLYWLVRCALAVLAPARWLLAAAVAGLAAWRLVEAWPALATAQRLGAATGGGSNLVAIQTAAAVAFAATAITILLVGVPRWRRRPRLAPERVRVVGERSGSFLDLFVLSNHKLVEWTLEHRKTAVALSALAFASIVIPKSKMSVAAFGEDEDNSRLSLNIDLEDNFSLAEAEDELIAYEHFFEAKKAEYGYEHLANRFDRRSARFTLYWESSVPPEQMESLRRRVLDEVPKFAGHKVRMRGDDGAQSKNKNQVVFRLKGPDADELEDLGTRAIAVLERVPGIHSVGTEREEATREVRVRFDSDLTQGFDLTPNTAFQSIAWALRGWQLPRFQEPGREVPLIIEYDDAEVEGLSTLQDMEVFSQASAIPLSSISSLEFAKASPTIERVDGEITYTILARVDDPLDQERLSRAGYAALRTELDLPRGFSLAEHDSVGARAEEEMAELRSAFLLSLVLVFLLMGVLFESALLPISVMFTIPFAVVGAYWALFVTGITMDSVGWIGIIVLVGVVVNNGIVLVDRIHQLRGEGWERSKAVLEGCSNRVRPVLMTALTTVFGLVPTIVSAPPSQGIDYRALATCVAGGLTISTFFTLWVVPLAYTYVDDLSIALRRRTSWAFSVWGGRRDRRADAAEATAPLAES
ncbi:MAG: efflux RND transporter permease subunit [Planctomycetes bacterium]|nr:efflux RND transporter permease subunit [Planctomycetota bacterium]